MEQDKIKFAVVGCGSIGRRHIAVLDAESEVEIDNSNGNEIDNALEMEELNQELDKSRDELESEKIKTNYNSARVNKSNPVRDKQSFLSRLFQGRTDRY